MIDAALEKHTRTIELRSQSGVKKVEGLQHKAFYKLIAAASKRVHAQLVGPAGSGKTYAAEQVAKALDLEYYAISVGAMTTKTDFQGYTDARGEYVMTLFRKAYEFGGVFLLDEFDAGNANVMTQINMALANNKAAFPDKMVEKHDDFILIACANTYGLGADRQYVGRNQLDAASIDRFVFINWDYDEDIEAKLAPNKRWAKYVQALRANLFKYKMRHVVSPRATIYGAELLDAGLSIEDVTNMVIYKGMSKSEKDQLTQNVTY
jgi:MoxR-like ATPase